MWKNDSEMIEKLRGLVSIESVSGETQGEYPFGKGPYDALEYALELCKSLGFKTKMCQKHCGYAEIGEGEEIFGILVHVDVVPPGDGWNTNPYDVVEKNGKLFGRGVIDDKGPALAVIYAMKELLENQETLKKRVRIIFGTTEETGDGEDLQAYIEEEELPTIGFTPDADFPVVYLEKGIAEIQLSMACEAAGIYQAEGGNASNMVADRCELTCKAGEKEKQCSTTGKSAHGSMPWLGENAIGKAMEAAVLWAKEVDVELPFATFYHTCIGMTYQGEGLGCNFQDLESGDTTVNPGIIEILDGQVVVSLDIRLAISCSETKLLETIQETVAPYGVKAELSYWAPPVHMDKGCEFIQELMGVYKDITGRMEEPMVMGGGTYARSMDHIVAFGPTFPGNECTEHQPNEYIYKADLIKAKEIYYEAIRRICSK